MDGLTFSGLTSSSLRVFMADRGGENSPAVAFVPSREGPVDSVEIANAVRQPEDYDAVRMALEREMNPERMPGSLWGLLEAIKQFYEEAMLKAHEARPDFFNRMQELSEKLQGAKDAQDLDTLGQLVAASSPEDMDKFLAAAEEMTHKLVGQGSEVQEPGKGPEGLSFKMSDVTLSIQPKGDNRVAVEFGGAKLVAQGPPKGDSGQRPSVELTASDGRFTVKTQKAEA